MPTDTTSRKRRKVDSTAEQEERADSGAGMLDQDEVRRHMMALMQQGGGGKRDSDGEGDEDESEEESEGSESGSDDEPGDEQEDDGEDEAKPKVELELDSDDAGSDDEEEDIKPVQITKLDTSDLKPSSLSRIKSLPSSSTPTSLSKPVLKTTFSSLGISPRLITSLRTLAISRPTEIQAACIEPILQGRDCIGGAKTGSGKTMAFALPILQRIVKDPFGIFAVVLTPTR
jgi:ATP-dependent RNA helicase DDX49/DBP8